MANQKQRISEALKHNDPYAALVALGKELGKEYPNAFANKVLQKHQQANKNKPKKAKKTSPMMNLNDRFQAAKMENMTR